MTRASSKVLLIVAALALFLLPAAAIAGGGFTDVDDDNVFKADIEWLADAGVTKGCNPPSNTEFCPESNVTRQQMAAFMHRLATNRVVDAGTVEGMTATELKGQKGDTGPAGADGDTITFYTVNAPTTNWDNEVVSSNPACNTGDQAISGSFTTVNPGPSVHIDIFTDTLSADGESWLFEGHGEGVGSYNSFVLCAHVVSAP